MSAILDSMFFEPLAKRLAVPHVADAIIARAARTPYFDLRGYIERDWLFNPTEDSEGQKIDRSWIASQLPSARVHHILRADNERHSHDHPWNARTFILRGWYEELREDGKRYRRFAGDTTTLRFGEYHRIVEVSPGGVWTLFVTGRHRGTWGFLVDGHKVPWREYLDSHSGTAPGAGLVAAAANSVGI